MGLRCGTPNEFDPTDKERFTAFVAEGGEVNPVTLPGLVDHAAMLVMLFADDTMIGTAAIKTPFAQHRRNAFAQAQVANLAEHYPLELGWVVVHPGHRKRGHGRTLVAEAAERAPGGTYATTKNAAMHAILTRSGFEMLGQPYRSMLNPSAELILFARPAG